MMVLSSPAFSKRRTELAELAVKHRLPTMFTFKPVALYVENLDEDGQVNFKGKAKSFLHRRLRWRCDDQ
jgi:hypothetical protein